MTADDSTVGFYNPEVVTANDYYPFGMLQYARSYSETGVGNYRYGFNRKKDGNEVEGVGNWQDYGLSKMQYPNASGLKINIEAAINTVFDNYLIESTVRALVAPLDVYEYTNRNSNQRDPKIRAENCNMAASAALNTLIGYASGKAIGSVFEGLLSKPVKAPYAPELVIAQETGLYRGDTRSPDEIFKSGFESKGTNTDVVDYVEANTPSVFVGISKDASEALQKVNTKGYVYVIGNNGAGLDINNYYKAVEDRANPHASEQEVIFEGKIPSSQIQGAYPVLNGKIDKMKLTEEMPMIKTERSFQYNSYIREV